MGSTGQTRIYSFCAPHVLLLLRKNSTWGAQDRHGSWAARVPVHMHAMFSNPLSGQVAGQALTIGLARQYWHYNTGISILQHSFAEFLVTPVLVGPSVRLCLACPGCASPRRPWRRTVALTPEPLEVLKRHIHKGALQKPALLCILHSCTGNPGGQCLLVYWSIRALVY